MNERIAAVIVAAGQATRFGAPKILTPISGAPAIVHVIQTFVSAAEWSSLVLVVSAQNRHEIEAVLSDHDLLPSVIVVEGGVRRQDSVAAGLAVIGNAEVVVIHDGARPLVSQTLIQRSLAAVLEGADAAVPALPVTDTLKRQAGDTVETVDRANLWRAQTPQAFRLSTLRAGFVEASCQGLDVTDEASLIEVVGGPVRIIPGEAQNIKLTTPDDLALVEALAGAGMPPPRQTRTGIGYDVHRLVPGRPLTLGGVVIPFERGLVGHSDADVLLHAICDAILGACALGDIGQHFPPADEAFRDISSLVLLERVRDLASSRSAVVINLDATLIAEAPKIAPYGLTMRERIAGTLQVPLDTVSIKATTNEGLGFAGRKEGIAALAIATVLIPA